MKKDVKKKIYMVLRMAGQENVRKVTLCDELFGVIAKQEYEPNSRQFVDVTTEEGLKTFVDIKNEVLSDEKEPIRIVDEKQLYYYVSSDGKRGVMFSEEEDAKNLFLNIDKTYDDVVNETVKTR